MIAFYVTLLLAAGTGLLYRLRQRAPWLVALLSGAAFVVTIAGILSFISLYVYEHPQHHCPFCILKPEYGYQGYWLYLPLFVATAAGLGVGAIQPFARIPSLKRIIPAVGKRLATVAAAMFVVVAAVASLMILNSRLILLEG